jgi:ribonuclease HI
LQPTVCSNVKEPIAAGSKRWERPPQGTLKISVDAAFNQMTGDAAVGMVIRDWEGSLKLTAWRVIFHCRDAEEAEAMACLEGVHMALRCPDVPMILESDCQSVVTKIQTKEHNRSSIWQVIKETWEVGAQLRSFKAVKINRAQNNLTHELAQFAIRSRECQAFFFCLFSRVGFFTLL